MNKKGFTLIEIIVSLTLTSIVLVFMLGSLVKVRHTYETVNTNTDALLYSSSISRILNNDILNNGGIRYVECNIRGDQCDIILANNEKRRIVIYDNKLSPLMDKYVSYNSIGDTRVKPSVVSSPENQKLCDEYLIKANIGTEERYYCPILTKVSTLKYTNTTESLEQLIFLKTLKLTENRDDTKGRVSTSGYVFGKMSHTIFESTNKLKYIVEGSEKKFYKNINSSIKIEIFDSIDNTSDPYGIAIYSTACVEPNMGSIGERITLVLNNETSGDPSASITAYIDEIIVKYGINFYKEDRSSGNLIEIDKITPPSIAGKTFEGYYYYDGSEDVQIIDKDGNIVVKNTYFTKPISSSSITLNARWS